MNVLEGKVVAKEGMKVGIVCSRFNEFITNKLLCSVLTFGDMTGRLNGHSLSCLISIGVAAVVYLAGVLLSKTIKKDDVLMLPKGEKIAEILAKYKLLG